MKCKEKNEKAHQPVSPAWSHIELYRSQRSLFVFSFKCLSKDRLIASFNVYISNKFMDSLYYDGNERTFHIVNRFCQIFESEMKQTQTLQQRTSSRENKSLWKMKNGFKAIYMCVCVCCWFLVVFPLFFFLLAVHTVHAFEYIFIFLFF